MVSYVILLLWPFRSLKHVFFFPSDQLYSLFSSPHLLDYLLTCFRVFPKLFKGNCYYRAVLYRIIEALGEKLELAAAENIGIHAACDAIIAFFALITDGTVLPSLDDTELQQIFEMFSKLMAFAKLSRTHKMGVIFSAYFNKLWRETIETAAVRLKPI